MGGRQALAAQGCESPLWEGGRLLPPRDARARYRRAAGSCRPGMRGPASLHSPVLRQALTQKRRKLLKKMRLIGHDGTREPGNGRNFGREGTQRSQRRKEGCGRWGLLGACLKSRYWRAAGSCRPGMRGPASLHSPVLRQALTEKRREVLKKMGLIGHDETRERGNGRNFSREGTQRSQKEEGGLWAVESAERGAANFGVEGGQA